MKKRLIITTVLVAVIASMLLLSFAGCGEPQVDAMILKQAPTVTSEYGQELAIADDGVIRVRNPEGDVSDVKITLDMIDQTGFDNKSLEDQTLKIKYGGKEVSFTFRLIREATSITVKNAPTCTSIYAGMPFEIADDGVLAVQYKDGGTADVTITADMLDLSGFDVDSTQEQTVKVVYGLKETSFKVTLLYDEIDDTGETQSFRFEAENADIGGGTVGVEFCGTDADGYLNRPDGTRDECVKNLFLGEGGYVTFNIVSSKRCHAKLSLSIGTTHFDTYNEYDKYARVEVNGEMLTTGIVYDAEKPVEAGGISPWWIFQLYEMDSEIILDRGVNVITIKTYGYAGITLGEDDTADEAGGRNLGYISISTTADLDWAPEE